MEPLLSFSGLELSLVEIILGAFLLLLGALLAYIFKPSADPMLRENISEMKRQQAELQGRVSQFADDSAQRDALFRERLDARLGEVTDKVGRSLLENHERSSQNLKALHERLALIDKAQSTIDMLSSEVVGLQSILSNKQSRGAFGEKQMQDLIENYLPPNAYSFQATLSSGVRVDALIHLPGDQGDVAIDSKFPLEAWRRLTDGENTPDAGALARAFAADVSRHIDATSSKYLIFGETHDTALMFLPSEAVYAELHANFPAIIDKSFAKRVMIVSPTTFMATLHTMRAVMKDAAMREQAHIIQREVGILGQDVARLDERVEKLQTHFDQTLKDVTEIRTSTRKIVSRAGKIEKLDAPEPQVKPVADLSGAKAHKGRLDEAG